MRTLLAESLYIRSTFDPSLKMVSRHTCVEETSCWITAYTGYSDHTQMSMKEPKKKKTDISLIGLIQTGLNSRLQFCEHKNRLSCRNKNNWTEFQTQSKLPSHLSELISICHSFIWLWPEQRRPRANTNSRPGIPRPVYRCRRLYTNRNSSPKYTRTAPVSHSHVHQTASCTWHPETGSGYYRKWAKVRSVKVINLYFCFYFLQSANWFSVTFLYDGCG